VHFGTANGNLVDWYNNFNFGCELVHNASGEDTRGATVCHGVEWALQTLGKFESSADGYDAASSMVAAERLHRRCEACG
jgi:hypothetical protein